MNWNDKPVKFNKPAQETREEHETAPLSSEAAVLLAGDPAGVTDRGGSAPRKLEHHGQVKSMNLPADWIAEPEHTFDGIGTRSLREFHPPGLPDVRLSFFYRGLPMNEEDGRRFCKILEGPTHTLSADELKSVAEVIRDASHPEWFKVAQATTADLNGKRVLLVEGTWTTLKNTPHTKMLFINADGKGKAVQEIFYEAPQESYADYSDIVDQSIKSIQWR